MLQPQFSLTLPLAAQGQVSNTDINFSSRRCNRVTIAIGLIVFKDSYNKAYYLLQLCLRAKKKQLKWYSQKYEVIVNQLRDTVIFARQYFVTCKTCKPIDTPVTVTSISTMF